MVLSMNGLEAIHGFKQRAVKLTSLVFIAAMVLAACSGQPGTSSGSTSAGTTGQTAANPTAPASSAPTAKGGGSSAASVSFSKDVQPILQSRCINCHGGARTQRGLDMSSYASLMAGSVNGAVVVPGNPSGSLIIQMVTQGKMPKNGPGLTPSQIQILTQWVQLGAPNN
jgi:uncharacterized membrane protein